MNYLYKHRDNSRKLPFDVMNIIYEYANPFLAVKKQIVNKDYDLDEIMYKRMLRFVKDRISRGMAQYLNMIFHDPITHINIYEERHKRPMLNYYRKNILYYELDRRRICGFDPRYDIRHQRDKMVTDLETNGRKASLRYSTKQLYKQWVKL